MRMREARQCSHFPYMQDYVGQQLGNYRILRLVDRSRTALAQQTEDTVVA